MQAGPFKSSILRLADREGVHVDDVLVADASRRTTTLNAYVSGLGSTRRVVVYDNLLNGLTPAEARVVIAHELGHAKHQDVLLGTLLGRGGQRRCRGAAGPAPRRPPGASAGPGLRARPTRPWWPWRCSSPASACSSSAPLQNTVSRAIEARADRTSIEATHADATFVQMQRRLALPRWRTRRLRPAASCGGGATPPCCSGPACRGRCARPDGEPRPGRDQRLPDPPRRDRVVRAGAVPGDAAPTRWSCTPPRCPATRSTTRAAVPGLPRPVRACCCRRRLCARRVRRGDAAARVRPGGVRGQRPARTARAGAAPGRCATDRRAHARPRGLVGHGPPHPAAAAPGRRLGRRADLRQRVVPRPHRARAVTAAAARMVRLSPGVDTDRFHPGCGGAEVRRRLGLGDAPVVVCTGRLVRRKGQDTCSGPGRRCSNGTPAPGCCSSATVPTGTARAAGDGLPGWATPW